VKLSIVANMMGSDQAGATTYRFAADAGAQRKLELGRQRGALRFKYSAAINSSVTCIQ
jgi:hypothetical protein